MMEHSSDDLLFEALRRAGNWCREYLELQHSSDVGAAFGNVMRTFSEIATPPAGGPTDRFERLKELERRLDDELAALAAAHEESVAARAAILPVAGTHDDIVKTRLFVYGTLKRGGCREFAMAGQRFVGAARTQPAFRLYQCGDYPALVRDANGISIEGELWEVDGACLSKLDEIEGVSMRLYERAAVSLLPPHDGEHVDSYFYLRSVNGLQDCGPRWP
jgi:gamma-glutamylaminecyclotransferase